MEDSELEDEVK